jgi:hypothetical protein
MSEALQQVEADVLRISGEKRRVDSELHSATIALRAEAKRLEILCGVLALLELAGNAARARVESEVGSLMTAAMQDIFGEDTDASVEFTSGARGYSARILTRGRGFRGDPMRTDGGSACRILEVALRAAFVKRLGGLPPLLILDEPLQGVDEAHIEGAAHWLCGEMAPALGLQLFLVKHEWPEAFVPAVDRVITIDSAHNVRVLDKETGDDQGTAGPFD